MVVSLSAYGDALRYLFARTTGATKLGLERTETLLEALGNPHDGLVAFHIAGTNGKGSVAAILERLLRQQGYKVGKYTSPHLVDFRERILIDGVMIDEETVVTYITRWTPTVERIGATFFEATTALAFDAFSRAAVDVIVVETGLGGRLDATNVLNPRVAIVTSIGLDHAEYLGDSLDRIAAEKAGIFKRGVPAVVGERSREIRGLLGRLARSAGASRTAVVADEMHVTDVSLDASGARFRLQAADLRCDVAVGLRGEHQVWNTCTAIAALNASGEKYRPTPDLLATGIANLELPGRCQIAGDVIFDVAHNPDGIGVLVSTLGAIFPGEEFMVLFSALTDKEWREMMRRLAPVARHIILTTAPTAPAIRRWDLNDARRAAVEMGLSHAVEEDFDVALASVMNAGVRVLVTGSFHTVGDAMHRLQVSPLTR